MRYIYSIIGAIILLISGTQSAFAQKETTITRTILGCTLEKSTQDSVVARLQELGADFAPTDPPTPGTTGLLVTGGVTFANTTPRILFTFVEKKLALITIVIFNKTDADRINTNLSAKYKNWEKTISYRDAGGSVVDLKTLLMHVYTYSNDYKMSLYTQLYPMETLLLYQKTTKFRVLNCS